MPFLGGPWSPAFSVVTKNIIKTCHICYDMFPAIDVFFRNQISKQKILEKIREKGIMVLKQIHPETWFTHKLLYTSSHLFLIPFFIYYFTEQSRIQSILFSSLFANFVFSIAFWHDPIKGSLVHRIDAAAARTSFAMLFVFIVFLRSLSWVNYIWFTLSLFTTVLFFYMSNTYSSYEWCCIEHILCHFMAHIFTTISILFAIL